MDLSNIKKVKCPLCGKTYVSKVAIYNHIEKAHHDMIPSGLPADRFYYDLTHKGRPKCVECGNDTPWNPKNHKYARLCGRPACKKATRAKFEERMLRVHQTTNLASDPEHQAKMQDGRSISGEYTWTNSTETTPYMGTYELDFLKHCDLTFDMDPDDVERCSQTFTYTYEGEKHFYMPDYLITPFACIVEIKDGGDNPNMHPKIQAVDKVKEKLKEEAVRKSKSWHYIKICNKQYGQFKELLVALKEDPTHYPPYFVLPK